MGWLGFGAVKITGMYGRGLNILERLLGRRSRAARVPELDMKTTAPTGWVMIMSYHRSRQQQQAAFW